MPLNPAASSLAARLVIAAVLLASAALAGCRETPSPVSGETAPILFNDAHVSPEPISTLGEHYHSLPPDPRHHYRLRELPNNDATDRTHRSL